MPDLRRSGAVVALGLFTVVPAPVVVDIDRTLARRALLAWPWLGVGMGLVTGALGWLVDGLGGGVPLAVLVALGALAGVTGAMHLDGLADTADGLGSRRPPEEALTVMRRSDIGPMGVAALVLVLLLDAAALAAPGLAGGAVFGRRGALRWVVMMLLPLVGRAGAVAAARRGLPGARTSGFGALVTGIVGPLAVVATLVGTVGVAGVLGWCVATPRTGLALAAAAVVALLVDAGWRRHLVRRLGGMTGDTFGSLVEVGQVCFAIAAALLV